MAARVLVSDELSPEAVRILADAGLEVDVKVGLPPAELEAIVGAYDALAVRSATKVTAKLLERATRLRVVGRAGVGVDNVDLDAATRRGVVVMNTPGGSSVTVAELALAMVMSLYRHVPSATASVKGGKWEKKRFQGREIAGQDPRRRRDREHRLGARGARARHEDAGDRVRPVHHARGRREARRVARRPRRPLARGRRGLAARAAHRADAPPRRRGDARAHEEGRDPRELRARRHRGRARARGGARLRPPRRRRARRVREGAAAGGPPAVRGSTTSCCTPHIGAVDRGGAVRRRGRGRGAARRVPARRAW